MTERLTLPLTIYRSLLDHALREAPWECCGLLGGLGGEVRSYHPLTNRALTPRTRYFASPEDLLPAMRTMREAGETLLAIYHSHPEGVPFPSETDRELAFYPQTVYLIVGPLHSDPGLLSSSPPEIRGFLLGGPDIKEVEIQLEGRHEDRRQILVDLLPLFGSAHHSESDLSREEAAAASNEAPPIPSAPERPLEAVLPQAVPVEDRPEELSGESPSEAQDEPVLGDGPLVERVEESSLVAQEVVEPSDDLTEEAIEESSRVVSEEAVAVEDRPVELSDEPPSEAQDEPVAGEGPLVERVEESSQVVQEVVEPSDDPTEESPQVVPEEPVPVEALTMEAVDNPPREVFVEIRPSEDPVVKPSDEAPPEQVVEEIASVVEPVAAAPGRSEEEGAGRLTAEPESLAAEPAAEIRTDGWASRLTRKIRSVIVRVARWAFSGRDRQ